MTAYLVLASVGLLLALLVSGRVAPAALFLGWAFAYHVSGLIDQKALLGGFVNPALATLVVLLMVSLVLERSPLLDSIMQRLLKGRPDFALLRLTGAAAALSGFLNNTAVVGSLLGPLSRQQQLPASKVLLPLSYAAVLGGITTLVGTSTNLVVNSFAIEAGLPPIGMFQLAWAGIPIAMGCLLVLVIASKMLPAHASAQHENVQRYFLETVITPDSPLVGRSIEYNQLRNLDGLFLLEIAREGRLISPVGPSEVLHEGDVLIFTGAVEKISALQRFEGLQFFGHQANALLRSNLVEVVVTNESELVHKTLRSVDFRTMFDAGVVGIRRGDQQLSGHLGRITLKAGDCLLLAVGADFAQHRNLDRNFVVVSGAPIRPRLTHRQSALAFGSFALVIGSAALDLVPLFTGLVLLATGLVVSGLLTLSEIRRRFPFELIVIIGSALTIARVVETSGAAELVVRVIQHVFDGYGVWGAFVGVYLATLLLTEVITNNAAAALGFPIALAAARAFDADPTPFILIVCYGASAGFLLPFGYQTHLMVYSPGRYRMTDFVKVGLPVSITYSLIALTLVPQLFPFF
ncbi:SLC13 family permease [Thauera sp. ZXT1-4]|uniref:SLC13 family permease n=1 Tax=Thauera sp. ZXT1-4 TaxID=3460294 RepID=UPI004040BD3D